MGIILYSLYFTICTALFCTVPSVVPCTVLYCALYCAILHCDDSSSRHDIIAVILRLGGNTYVERVHCTAFIQHATTRSMISLLLTHIHGRVAVHQAGDVLVVMCWSVCLCILV